MAEASFFRQSSREKRLICFSKERQEIPAPHWYEDFEGILLTLTSERDAFHKKYRKALETPPDEPAISSDVFCALSDDEADRVFEALKKESVGDEDVLLLGTRRGVEREYARCIQVVYEQELLVNALKDVSKMQTLLYDYMREQTARGNLERNPYRRKENRAIASGLLEHISEIGSGNCRFPAVEKRKKKEFHYQCIRDCETLRDEKGNLVLPMPLMRSLAFLHLHFNDLDVESAMDVQSIAFAEHSGEDLLTLARNDLDSSTCQLLLTLSSDLCKRKEPVEIDFQRYPKAIEKLPALPKLILTLLYRDIAASHPIEVEDEIYGREDLLEQHRKGGDFITDTERAVLMREMIEYLADYTEALAEANETGEESDGFMVRNTFRIYALLRENARKYLLQTGVDFLYLTGSDHSVKHLIRGDVRFSTQVAKKLKWSARDRVCLRQIAVDHDLGYTHAALQFFSMHEDGIPLCNGYYNLTKDHPLYSSAYFEVHRPEYEEYFGREGAHIIGLSILDHSEVKGHLREEDPAKRVQALFCRIDCMAVSADLKSSPTSMDDRVLVAMSKAMEAAEYLKGVDERMKVLWREGKVRSGEYRWLAAVQESLRTIAGQVKQYLLGLTEEIYKNPVYQQAYYHAIDQHFDPFNPTFPVQRDFGSNAISFAGIDVYSAKDRDHLVARWSVEPLLFFTVNYFGAEQGATFATSAIKKLLDDFGGAIHNPAKIVEALDVLSSARERWHTEKDIDANAPRCLERIQHHATHVHFQFEIPKRGEKSKLIERMVELIPYQEVMRELMQPDFDEKRLQLVLKQFAKETKNKAISARVQKGELGGATTRFFEKHFSLST